MNGSSTHKNEPFQTMFMKSIETAPRHQRNQNKPFRDLHLKINDIPGAQTNTIFHTKKLQHSLSLNTSDIEGANSMKLIPDELPNYMTSSGGGGGGGDRILRVKDITTQQKFVTSRHLNPLNPRYKLPSFTVRIPTPPPKRRDTNKISDIEGATTRVPPLLKKQPHENIVYHYSSAPTAILFPQQQQSSSVSQQQKVAFSEEDIDHQTIDISKFMNK